MELEKFRGVVVFTTNLIDNYDSAFKRRILLSIYFEMPDEKAREKIWNLHLGNKLPLEDSIDATYLAKKYEGISGADIKDIVFYSALNALENDKKFIDNDSFDEAFEIIKNRYTNQEIVFDTNAITSEKISEKQYLSETSGEK